MRLLFMGGNPVVTILMLVGIFGGIAVIFIMSAALRRQNIHVAAYGASGILAVVIFTMCVMRDMLRDAYLQPYFHPQQFIVQTQWSVFPLFLALFVGGVVLWFVMLYRYGIFGGNRAAEIAAAQAPAAAKK